VAGLVHGGRRGLAVFAISAIDVAAWDVAAKALGVPLWQMLGGSPEPLDTYASEGLWLTDDFGRLGAEAAELVGLGFRAVKMRLGRAREADDLAAARAVRDAIGPDIRLMADANQGWDVEYALRLGRKLEDAGIDLTWFEEPIPHDDVAGQARLAAELRTPLATGNSFRCGILVDLFRGNSRRHDLRTTSSRHREACYCIDAPTGTTP
jgi:L-alanine-DL-glutamate epimerase-like enolase superfamily enzyme